MRFQAVVFDFVSGQGEGRIQEFCCFLKANTFCSGAVARETGGENIKARMVSARLQCSTQPVMHHFATIKALKWAVLPFGISDEPAAPFLGQDAGIGLNCIRFAIEEPHLFRSLFQLDF